MEARSNTLHSATSSAVFSSTANTQYSFLQLNGLGIYKTGNISTKHIQTHLFHEMARESVLSVDCCEDVSQLQ